MVATRAFHLSVQLMEPGVWMASSAHVKSTALQLALVLQISVPLPLQLAALKRSVKHGPKALAQSRRHAVARRPMVATRAFHPSAQLTEPGVWMASSAHVKSTALQLALVLQISVPLPLQLAALQRNVKHGLMAPARSRRHAV